jgi:hypothetical protein
MEIFLSLSLGRDISYPFMCKIIPKINEYISKFTFHHPLFHLGHRSRKDVSMHRLLGIDQASLEVLLSTAQTEVMSFTINKG